MIRRIGTSESSAAVMVIERDTHTPKRFGHVFISDTADAEDLVLVSRAGDESR
jgi:hypothetical protein